MLEGGEASREEERGRWDAIEVEIYLQYIFKTEIIRQKQAFDIARVIFEL